jgi:uncharacterized protein (TIGR00369 family)
VYGSDYNACFGCGPENPAGLRLKFEETNDGVEVHYTVHDDLRGAPGVVHGGIQATLLDETLCMTAYAKLGMSVVTGELTVRYEKSVPTDTALLIRGRIVETKGRSAFIEGGIYLAATGEQLTKGRGRFFEHRES